MKYYITGANGFIGTAICNYLSSLGDDVVKMPHDTWMFSFDKDSVVIHLAAYGNHYHQTDKEQIITANVHTLYRLLESFSKSNAQGFVNISSSSVTLPVQTLYSASKLFGEQLVKSYNDDRMINVRPYSVYGPGEAPHRFIPTVIRHLQTGEVMPLSISSFHDWIYIDDFVDALFSGSIDIGTGISTPNIKVVQMLEEISGKKLNYDTGNKLRSYDTNFWECKNPVPARSLYDGLKQTYDSFTR